ncbi:MAG: hypothetical protein HZA24_04010 [Nitrospirae bacterium]|nr:hypothetical protein [Nitrospirota bacterium]
MINTRRRTAHSIDRPGVRAAAAAGLALALLLGACGGGGGGTGDTVPAPAGGPSTLNPSDTVSGGPAGPGGTSSAGHDAVVTDGTLY